MTPIIPFIQFIQNVGAIIKKYIKLQRRKCANYDMQVVTVTIKTLKQSLKIRCAHLDTSLILKLSCKERKSIQ